MKVSIYTRVSTGEQDTKNQSAVLIDWAKQTGFEVVKIYEEQESAWRNGHQRELARLFADLHRRKVYVCLVWALDHLTREGIARIFELINRFKAYGVRVISYQESWTEQTGPMADLLYAITAWVAEFESKRRSERTLAGLARALREDKKLGRPKGSKDKAKRQRTGYLLRYANPTLKERYSK